MNVIFILLLIPFALAGKTAPGCPELKSIVNKLEADIQNKNLGQACQGLDVKELLGKDPVLPQKEILAELKCQNLAAIELRLKTLENEQAMLMGINKLVNEVKVQKKKTQTLPPEESQAAARSFVDNLVVAQTLELILSTEGNFLEELSKVEAKDRGSLEHFVKLRDKKCEGMPGPQDSGICSTYFAPTAEAMAEMYALTDLALTTNRKLGPKQLKELRSSMTIIKESNEPYSFTAIREELKEGLAASGKTELTMSKQDVKVIGQIPEFKHHPLLSFMDEMNSARTALSPTASTRFNYLMEDLKKRQEWERESKFSLLKFEFEKQMNEEPTCQKVSPADYSRCLHKVAQNPSLFDSQKAHLLSMSEGLEKTQSYLTSLLKTQSECRPDEKGEIKKECAAQVSARVNILSQESEALNALKKKILEESTELMTMRNFAVEKLDSQKCFSLKEDLAVGDCYDQFDTNISKEAFALMNDGINIALVFTRPEAATDISGICQKGEEKIIAKDRLCAFLTDKTSDLVESRDSRKDHEFRAPVKPESGGYNPHKEALLNGATSLLMDLAKTFGPQTPRPANPYPYYNYQPSNGKPMMSISDSILFDARVQGAHGLYRPTPGVQPYSPSGNLGTYTPLHNTSGTASTYFSAPGGR
jgi:hypothetical protein